ncbi:MAG: hypothetical protein LUE10_03820 [Alistipes sp.]|nr:hypothetical protein [Alistipes sp.]
MEIFIDGVRMDTDSRTVMSVTLAISSVSDPGKNRTGYTNPVILPATATNRRVMAGCDQVHSAGIFNHSRHRARVESRGCTVMEGTAVLLSCTAAREGDVEGYYRLGLVGGGKLWADYAASLMLRALPLEFGQTLSESVVLQSWTWDAPVRFLPVERDGFAVENPSANLIKPARILSFEDYHPFLHLKSLLEAIFCQAGYRLASKFIERDFFAKLHISGNYPSTSADAVKARMDFRAGRFYTASAAADSMGRVYADPYRTYSTIGNIVETADPTEVRDGLSVEGVYDTGGCFLYDGQRVTFTPLVEVVASFEYRIYYTTDYYIESRSELTGFNTLYLGDGQTRRFALSNRNIDRRGEFKNTRQYTVVVFGHIEGAKYRFAYDRTVGGAVSEYIEGDYFERSFTVNVGSAYEVSNPKLYLLEDSGAFVPLEGDWALYDGYVAERGTMEVELRIRSSAERLLPSAPKVFDAIWFGGANPGMNFTLGAKTTLRPIFTQYPTIGSKVAFEDVAAHRVTCLDLVKSVQHLFNLRFYTDELSKTVYADPPEDFYAGGPVINWSAKVDRTRPVLIREPAENTASLVSYSYQSGDGAVTRRNLSAGDTLGRWSVAIENNLAKSGEQAYGNPMFTASVNAAGDYPDAPDASLLRAGDRDSTSSDDMQDLNFLPKIVVYEGMRELPHGQHWGWPAGSSGRYPYLAFHHSTADNTGTGDIEPFTLCFEERDGLQGLGKYRQGDVARLRSGKRIEVYMDLTPADIKPFIRPDSARKDFRGLYRLEVGGEEVLCRLEEIAGYDPRGGSTVKCVFILEYTLS